MVDPPLQGPQFQESTAQVFSNTGDPSQGDPTYEGTEADVRQWLSQRPVWIPYLLVWSSRTGKAKTAEEFMNT